VGELTLLPADEIEVHSYVSAVDSAWDQSRCAWTLISSILMRFSSAPVPYNRSQDGLTLVL